MASHISLRAARATFMSTAKRVSSSAADFRPRVFADDGIVRAEDLAELLGPGSPRPVIRGLAPPLPEALPSSTTARHGDFDDVELKRLDGTPKCPRRELALQAGLSKRTPCRRLKVPGLA
jgi:hypothetical protein